MLRPFGEASYYPTLGLRPAEMAAVFELPSRAKARIFPTFQLKPWLAAASFENALDQVNRAYPNLPWIAGLDDTFQPSGRDRPADATMLAFRNPANGFANWVAFVEGLPNAVPSLLVGPPDQVRVQLESLASLGRGVVVRVPEFAIGTLQALIDLVNIVGYTDVLFVLDFQRIDGRYLAHVAAASSYVRRIMDIIPDASIVISSSSFPSTFVGRSEQSIFERSFFNGVVQGADHVELKFGDFGSVRIDRGGGGGAPTPRVDYATFQDWRFFRQELGDDYAGLSDTAEKAAARFECYQTAALALMATPRLWRPNLRIWGTQMIERTAAGDDTAIRSPVRSTAVRINLHLHLQSYFGDIQSAEAEADDDWED